AEKIFGWTAGQAIGKRLPFIQAEKQVEFEGLLLRALRGEAYIEPELHRRRADGSPVVVSVSAAPLRGDDGSIYGVMEILSDETGRSEDEESRKRLLMALEQAGDSVILTDARGVILYVNSAFERMTGFSRKDVLGQKPQILKSGKRDGDFYRKLWEAVGKGETWRGTLVNRKEDGTLFEEDAVISPVRDPSGRIVSYIGIQRDVAPFREMKERASRDRRRPLPGGDSRLFQPRALDLNGVLAGMERMLRRLSGEEVDLSMALGRDIRRVKASPGKVEQLVAVLTVHARSMMPLGGRISVKTANVCLPSSGDPSHPGVPAGFHVLLSVEADAEGMDSRNEAGPAEAYDIVHEYGGRIRVGHPEGRGAGYYVYLPRFEPPGEERFDAEQGRLGSLTPGTGTVLLVEDEDVVRLPAGEILRTCGYAVIEARNGKEAQLLSEAHQGKIDLLLTDVRMPKMDGLELANRMQETRPDTKILLMSGYTNKGPIDNPEKRIAFLQKPFTAEALSLKVRETLAS
ncbi:MAG: domain S-box-containing protein, partial [Deltaproteobacteria bacterium]|nr:domain S-box-containing protein [Deltaproteobacteria bacterium]